jgi:hypothetical protein
MLAWHLLGAGGVFISCLGSSLTKSGGESVMVMSHE